MLSQNTSAPVQNACPATLKVLPSDPAYSSGISTVILTSATDYSEYLCGSGIGYMGTGISCYQINCQSQNDGGYNAPRPQYGSMPYQQPIYPQPGQYATPTSVGKLVAQVETAYPCWKLKQIRLNNYVYLVCFIKNYDSLLFQVVFKENYQLALVQSERIPYKGLTALGKSQFTAENGFVCLLAVYSSDPPEHYRDKKREPSDLLAPMYTICPNNYRWYFCGNINIEDTIDVTVWYSQAAIHAVFVQLREVSTCNSATAQENKYTLTPLIQYSITPNVELYECSSKQEQVLNHIGRLTDEAANQEYTLCGVDQCIVASGQNGTILCCAVTVDHTCPIPGAPTTTEPYSSFCLPYNVATNKYSVERVVFLAGSEQATDIQYVRANGECCQFIVTANPAGPLEAYSLASIITQLNEQTAPVTLKPVDLGNDHMFSNSDQCTFKSKCCNSQVTCVSCTRPAKYGDRYFGTLSCGNTGISNPYQTYNNPNFVVTEDLPGTYPASRPVANYTGGAQYLPPYQPSPMYGPGLAPRSNGVQVPYPPMNPPMRQ